MKVLFIHTESNEIPKYVESLRDLGHEIDTFMFQHALHHGKGPLNIDDDVMAAVEACKPEMIVYVGACGRCTKPSVGLFATLNEKVAPCVIIISDAADEMSPWWKELFEYDEFGCFRVMVAIDGNKNWPFHERHLTMLTPISPSWFPNPKRHSQREVKFGFAGNVGRVYTLPSGRRVGRKLQLDHMVKWGCKIKQRDGTVADSWKALETYKEMCRFMLDTRITPNFSETGSFQRRHVKGRVVEAGLAGCLLLEEGPSPTRDWFEPGVDFLEYKSIDEAKELVRRYIDDPDESEKFGLRLRAKILAEHTPEKFWGRIISRLRA